MKDEFVYVIGTPGNNTVKIGRTNDLARRITEIQRMSPVPLVVLWAHPGDHQLETHLHRHFSSIRSHGEWFRFAEDPVELIRSVVAERPWRTPINRPKARQLKVEVHMKLSVAVSDQKKTPRPGEVSATVDAAVKQITDHLTAIRDPADRYNALVQVEADWKAARRASDQRFALRLKQQGKTWREVGEQMGGVTAQRAHQIALGPQPGKRSRQGD